MQIINLIDYRFEESGVKDRMWANWTYVPTETFWEEEVDPIDETLFSFPAFILVGGIVLSMAFLLFEKIALGSASEEPKWKDPAELRPK